MPYKERALMMIKLLGEQLECTVNGMRLTPEELFTHDTIQHLQEASKHICAINTAMLRGINRIRARQN